VLPGLLLAAVLTVAACGGQQFPRAGSPPPSAPGAPGVKAADTPQARLLAAVRRSTALKTARVALTMSVSGIGKAPATALDWSGVIDMAGPRMVLSLHKQGNPPLSLEMRVIGRTAYVRANGRWTSLSLSTAGSATAVPDPTSYLAYLQGVSDDVHVDGREKLRGDDTTRYSGTIDLDRAIAQSKPTAAQRAVISRAVELFGDLQIPMQVWVDDHGRLRKLRITMDLTDALRRLGLPSASTLHPKIDLTMELYDFGVPVVVSVPAGASATSSGDAGAAQDRAVQSDLRNALTAEKVFYTDHQAYASAPADLRPIESSLDWGGALSAVTGDAVHPGDRRVLCLAERSKSGTLYAIADVADGPLTGTYYGTQGCTTVVNAATVSRLTPIS